MINSTGKQITVATLEIKRNQHGCCIFIKGWKEWCGILLQCIYALYMSLSILFQKLIENLEAWRYDSG